MSQIIEQYVSAFENLTPENLNMELSALLDEEILFKDPFNEVRGKAATLAIFEHMFASLEKPRFEVVRAAQQDEWAYLDWTFHFCLRPNSDEKTLQGLSRVRINDEGLISEHIDFWDAGEQVYAKVPLLGWGIRQVAKRLRATTS